MCMKLREKRPNWKFAVDTVTVTACNGCPLCYFDSGRVLAGGLEG